MLNFCSLYSGSSGNCLFVESDNTKILVDAGVSLKKIEKGLESIGVSPSSLDGVLITHEHSDHIQSLGNLSRKFNLPVFANAETFDAMPKQTDKIADENIKKFKVEDTFSINDIDITPFSIPHDAANPCGFNISCNSDTLSIATDIGHITNEIVKKLEASKFILLESNYDTEVLKYSKYPFALKQRIAGPNGHLSNESASKAINYLVSCNLKTAMLGHLSKENNFPELAYQTTVNELIEAGTDVSKLSLSVASRDTVGNLIHI